MVLLCLGVGAWFGLRWLQAEGVRELSRPRTIGPVQLFPEGFRSEGWLRYHWDRLRIVFPGGQVTLVKPELTLRLATTQPFYEHLRLRMNTCILQLDLKKSPPKTASDSLPSYVFPEFSIPVKVLLQADHFSVHIPQQGSWYSDSLILRNPDRHSVFLQFQEARGKFLAYPVHAQFSFRWPGKFVEAEASLQSEQDTIELFAEASKQKLDDASAVLSVKSQSPQEWIPLSLPESTPTLHNLQLQGNAHLQLSPLQIQWQAEARLDLGALPKLPPGTVRLKASGDHRGNVKSDIDWTGSHAEHIQGKLSLDENRRVELQAEIENTYIDIGSRRLNADGRIERAVLFQDTAEIELVTQSGSRVRAKILNLKDPFIQLQANVSPTEPWAISWCDSNLQIGTPATIEGEFHHGILTANVRAAVPFAYKASAERFETDLTLSAKGVYFDNGSFITRGVEHRFLGEVVWDEASQPHFQFEILQDSGGVVKVYGDFDGHISLNISQIPTWKLPLADTGLFRGIHAVVTGNWEHRFEEQNGVLRLSVETSYKDLPIHVQVLARQNLDSLILENMNVETSENRLQANALALLDSTAEIPVVLQRAALQTQGFSLPALLKGIGDSSLAEATLHGDFSWDIHTGFLGKFTIPEIALRSVNPGFLRVQRFQLLGSGDQLQASARVRLGPDGVWDSETEINLKGVLSPHKGLAAAIVADNGGVLWLEGILDSNYIWKGDAHLEGLWYLPGGIGEVQATQFSSHLEVNPSQGLAGIKADFSLDTAYFVSSGFSAPISAQGKLDSANLFLDRITILGKDSSRIDGNFAMNLEKKELLQLKFLSQAFHLEFAGTHHIYLHDFSGEAIKKDHEMQVSILLPKGEYKMHSKTLGDAYGKFDANILYRQPIQDDSTDHVRKNARIEGRVQVERFTFDKTITIETSQIGKLLQKATGSLKSFGQKGSAKERRGSEPVKKSAPTELDIRILDPGKDSLLIRTTVAQFPFTLDVQLQGTTEDPLLNGDINAVGKGYLGFETLADFELQSLRIWWQDTPPKKGQVDLLATTEIPYCEENDEGRIETCPVLLNVNGPLTEPNPQPSANCAVESSPAQIYYAVLILGCFPSEHSSTFDAYGAGGKLVGMLASKQTNAWLGGDYVGNIGLKWRFDDPNSMDQRDSNYIRIPVKLDRWVKNLSFVVGYSKDLSQNPRYDQSYEAGLKYSMPVLDSGENIPNHVDPTLDFSGSLIQRRYQATLDGGSQESRLEKNIGVAYSWRFWDYCLFGFGMCPDSMGRKP